MTRGAAPKVAEAGDFLTVLRCHRPLTMAKTWTADGGIKPYGNAKHFAVDLVEVNSVQELSAQLFKLERRAQACIIRGRPKSGLDLDERVRRLGANFEDQPLHSILIEVDGYETIGYSPLQNPLGAALEYVECALPECFSGASFHWQMSNSAGHPKHGDALKIHLWFWLSEPQTSAALKAWAEASDIELDRSVFNTVQIHYTAAPVFEDGVESPIRMRSGFFQGVRDEVELTIKEGLEDHLARSRPSGESSPRNDPRADWLVENWEAHGVTSTGALKISCPFDEDHTTGIPGDSSTVYLPAHTRGYAEGQYKCSHSHCSHRRQAEFDAAVGYEGGPLLDRLDPLANSRIMAAQEFSCDGLSTLIRSQEEWLRYVGTHYEPVSDEDIRNAVWNFLGRSRRLQKGDAVPFQPLVTHVTATADALRSVVAVDVQREPAWLGRPREPSANRIVSLENGLLDLATRTLIPHTPSFFTRNSLPFPWRPNAGRPARWLKFLSEVFDGDQEQISTLQEVMGYLLTPDTSLQKIFFILGPKRSGKGTIARVIEGLLGASNVASPTLTSLTGEFGCQPLVGKLLALVSDVRISSQMNKQAAIERLLMVSGEDSVTVNRKHREPWIGHLLARFLLMSNELPQLPDSSGALTGRFHLLETKRSFFDKEDPTLGERLRAELPLILHWALDGLDRLLERGRFIQPKGGQGQLDALNALNSPYSTFVQEFCQLGSGRAWLDELFAAWTSWREEQFGQAPGSKDLFSRNLTANYPELRRVRPRKNGVQDVAFEGIRLRGDAGHHADLGRY
jgi:P4 family phage/plasmid primase-like protien